MAVWAERLAWLVLLGLTIATRIAHIRHLVLPNWVDPIHHLMIVRLFLEHMRIPLSYDPFIPNSRAFYHWGFHALTALAALPLGTHDAFTLATFLLWWGQLLNALTPLALALGARLLYRNRTAALLAAVLGALVSWMPAYYVSWGRYTHLLGVLIAVLFVQALWRLHTSPAPRWWFATIWWGLWLALVHLRVAVFTLTLVACLVLLLLAQRAWRSLWRWGVCGMVVALLLSPWLWWLIQQRRYAIVASSPPPTPTISTNLLWIPHNAELLTLATGGVAVLFSDTHAPLWLVIAGGLWALVLYATLWRGRSHAFTRRALGGWLLLALWSALTVVVVYGRYIGLPSPTFVNVDSAFITLFVPLSLAGGGLVAWVLHVWLTPPRARLVGAVLATLLAVWGAWAMRDIVNPITVLATADDVAALRWVRDATPPNALFVTPARLWQYNIYVGSDGGYWLSVLTDRASLPPPSLYTVSGEPDWIRETNALLEAWATADGLDDTALLERLQAAGVTHIFIGAKNAHWTPPPPTAPLDLVFQHGQTRIYAFRTNR
ncbi:hypothetical protein [Ardenticatena maritima]|nr:hypothetical protein [Ardenticatena maritima]